jgi:O-methyltransferase
MSMRSIKAFLKWVFGLLGLSISRLPSKPHTGLSDERLAQMRVKEAEFYSDWVRGHSVFTPWIGHREYLQFCDGISQHTLVSPDRCYTLMAFAKYASLLKGDFAECGVYRGGTSLILSRILKTSQKKLYIFDSFEGLGEANPDHDNYFKAGDFSDTSRSRVETLLAPFAANVVIKQGWIPHTFKGLDDRRFALVHIDVDLYQAALDCCNFFYNLMTPGGVLLFDEYGFPNCQGEKDAVDYFFSDKPERPITLATGQALVIKAP